MSCKLFLNLAGLAFNILGTLILALPLLSVKKDLDDDLLVGGGRKIVQGKEKITYIRRGFYKDRNITLLGLFFLLLGFVIQFVQLI
jgi:hypothetical protein